MAKQLVEKHRMKEKQAAALLGISQSAVSKSTRNIRGTTVVLEGIEEVEQIINKILNLLIHEPHKKTEIMHLFCQACTFARKDGLMCPFCLTHARETDTKNCDFCASHGSQEF